MTEHRNAALVDTEWLAGHLDDPDICILDGTFHLPNVPRNAREEYAAKHLPGAQFFDIDGVCDPASPYPHMLPSPDGFAETVGKMGIGNDTHVIVYDVYGVRTSPRVWWTFRVFGHGKVSVLDGGFPKWLAEDRPTTAAVPSPTPTTFRAAFRPELVRTLEQMKANVRNGRELVVDSRPKGRFEGSAPEPRPGLKSGHIPGSVHIDTNALYREDMTVRPAEELSRIFEQQKIPRDKPLVMSCGSGVMASNVAFTLYLLGETGVPVYDGSWSEWGAQPDTPAETD